MRLVSGLQDQIVHLLVQAEAFREERIEGWTDLRKQAGALCFEDDRGGADNVQPQLVREGSCLAVIEDEPCVSELEAQGQDLALAGTEMSSGHPGIDRTAEHVHIDPFGRGAPRCVTSATTAGGTTIRPKSAGRSWR